MVRTLDDQSTERSVHNGVDHRRKNRVGFSSSLLLPSHDTTLRKNNIVFSCFQNMFYSQVSGLIVRRLVFILGLDTLSNTLSYSVILRPVGDQISRPY